MLTRMNKLARIVVGRALLSASISAVRRRAFTAPLRNHLPKLGHVSSQRTDRLRSLLDQKLTHAEHRIRALGFLSRQGDKPHRGTLRRFTDCFGVGHVVRRKNHSLDRFLAASLWRFTNGLT